CPCHGSGTTDIGSPTSATPGTNDNPSTDQGALFDVRLENGRSANEGRLEIFFNGKWGTVCSHGWTLVDANVVCRQLGYPCADITTTWASHGEGTGRIWFRDAACKGNEARLADCPHSSWGYAASCGHSQDVGVVCRPYVRLVGGSSNNEGRVEIFYNGEWGTVCSGYYWDLTEAYVVCRQLGYPCAGLGTTWASFGEGTGRIWLRLGYSGCSGHEARLADCRHEGWGDVSRCNHGQDVGVVCRAYVRLVDGRSASEGRLEIFYNGEWGTVCSHNWHLTDAYVVCRQLGYPCAYLTTTWASFGEGTGRIWFRDAACTGNEARLADCPHSLWGYAASCAHSQDVGIVCRPYVRLVGGSSSNEGRVEIFYNGEWGTVCSYSWDLADASVVCRQLGYHCAGSTTTWASFGEGTGQIWLRYVRCSGHEARLADCSHYGWGDASGCNHGKDVGVICRKCCLEESDEQPGAMGTPSPYLLFTSGPPVTPVQSNDSIGGSSPEPLRCCERYPPMPSGLSLHQDSPAPRPCARGNCGR
ncbi:DMBT1, partial [Branchiostoma lanceolatum]